LTASVSVVIAARNEEARIAGAIDSAFAAGAAEVIVADGASGDRTREIAASRGATVLPCEPMRARQFNRGAAAAKNETLIFLHADTTVPPGAAAAAAEALAGGAAFGGFRIQFAEPFRRLRFVAFMVNLRTRFTRCPWGDQAQFITRSRFLADGGFREIPLMEDYELAVRMKRNSLLLPLTVTTSGRRFLEQGVIRTTIMNWIIIAAWRAGVSAHRLATWYRGDRSSVTSSSRDVTGRD
jgi:rSAM/selenodomain-associated transferase 2